MDQRAEFKLVAPASGDRATWTAAFRGLQRLIDRLEPEEFVFLTAHLEKALAPTQQASRGSGTVGEAGLPYGRAEEIAIELEVLLRSFRHRQELLRDSLSATEVAALLGTSRQTPHDRAGAGTLLGILDRGTLRFPPWQFDPTGPNGVIAGVPEVLQALRADPYSKLTWLMNPRFDGRTPVDLLKRGELRLVVMSARASGAH